MSGIVIISTVEDVIVCVHVRWEGTMLNINMYVDAHEPPKLVSFLLILLIPPEIQVGNLRPNKLASVISR